MSRGMVNKSVERRENKIIQNERKGSSLKVYLKREKGPENMTGLSWLLLVVRNICVTYWRS